MRNKIYLLVIFIFGGTYTYGLETQDTTKVNINADSLKVGNGGCLNVISNDFKSVLKDYSEIFSNITLSSALCKTGEVAAFTGVGCLADKTVDSFFERNIRGKADGLFDFLNFFGKIQTAVEIGGITYLGGLAAGNDKIRICGKQMFEALLLSSAFTLTIKTVVGRHRPFVNDGAFKFTPFSFQDKYNSLPSGDVTVAFSLASVVSQNIDKWWAYLLCYGIAGGTASSRIYYDKHWLSDTILGASIGTISGIAVVKAGQTKHNWSIGFYPNGVNFTYIMK